MIALDDRPARCGASPLDAPRRRPSVRPREVARRRPAGRPVEYGTVPTRVTRRAVPRSAPEARVRARVMVALAALVLILAVGVLAFTAGGGTSAAPLPAETGVVQVRPGENLTSLAARVAPGVPSSQVVQRIVQLNELDTVAVRAGQALVVPVGK